MNSASSVVQTQQPVADRDGDRRGAGRRAQREAGRDRQHVENDDVLQERRIRRQQHEIRRGRGEERQAERERGDQRQRAEDGGRRQREVRADCARGNRPLGFERMALILFAIEHVVDEIDRAGERAENEERRDRFERPRRVGEPLGKHQGREDEEVLRPLARAQ